MQLSSSPRDVLRKYWGYDAFLPGQTDAIEAVLSRRDSLVIYPTGGGKSLTYQLPALMLPGTAVVVSPLISLMKDQVDALVASGIAAASLNSSLEPWEDDAVRYALRQGAVKLLYVSPERLLSEGTIALLRSCNVSFVAIDEAHCISQWGHDFRAEYRELGSLRDRLGEVPIHACTATATSTVRTDIVRCLRLREPVVFVGDFDRPNLTYRLLPRTELRRQLEDVLFRHRGEAGIIYCIRKADVDELCPFLVSRGYRALPYHAGLSSEVRQKNQDAFSTERADIVVATVAFGMGIDRSNVRYVIHTGMPKSLEHYSQETGRAGRDGLPAECVLFYSGQDPIVWKTILGDPVTDADEAAHHKIDEMYRLCRSLVCRHRALAAYFGQAFGGTDCRACDRCLGEHAMLEDAFTVARQILSCVARVRQNFGLRYVAEVLKGSRTARIISNQHDLLTTYGLLKSYSIHDIGDWIDQLVAAGYLQREGEYAVLRITAAGKELLKGEGTVVLSRPRHVELSRSSGSADAPAEADTALFEVLRTLRRELAQERGVPPFVIFGDTTLRELATYRPVTPLAFRQVRGVGDTKARDLGPVFIEAIQAYLARIGPIAPSVLLAPLRGEEKGSRGQSPKDGYQEPPLERGLQ